MDSNFSQPSASGGAPLPIVTYTWATKPSAVGRTGQLILISDVGCGQSGTGGGLLFTSNGTRWKLVNLEGKIDGVDTRNVGVANTTEQDLTPNSVLLPAALTADTDTFLLRLTLSKSGSSDSCTVRLRLGTTGTNTDPVLTTITSLSGASVSFGSLFEFKRISSTTVQKMGSGDSTGGFSGPSVTAIPAAVTVPDMSSNALRFKVWAQMTGGTEFAVLEDMQLFLSNSDNV